MKKLNSRDLVIYLEQSVGNFISFSGLKTSFFEFEASQIYRSNDDNAKQWRELLVPASKKHLTILAEGMFKNTASDQRLRDLFFDNQALKMKIMIAGFAEISGAFQISKMHYSASGEKELSFEFTLQSTGKILMSNL